MQFSINFVITATTPPNALTGSDIGIFKGFKLIFPKLHMDSQQCEVPESFFMNLGFLKMRTYTIIIITKFFSVNLIKS